MQIKSERQPRLIRAAAECRENTVTRILPFERGATIYGLRVAVPDFLSSTHIGYLSRVLIDVKKAAFERGRTLQIFLADEQRAAVEPCQQLRPGRRLLFLGLGKQAAIGLQAIATAELRWPKVEGTFDLDGYLS